MKQKKKAGKEGGKVRAIVPQSNLGLGGERQNRPEGGGLGLNGGGSGWHSKLKEFGNSRGKRSHPDRSGEKCALER